MHVVCVFGTRPEAIKMAPVVKQLQRHADQLKTSVWVTAQHRDMLDQALALFGIQPTLDLNIMQQGQTPTQVAALVLERLEPALAAERPDWVLVQGDTTTVMATAIAAHYQGIKVGHVEAGLRTFNRKDPFPEEMNRVVADAISDLHLAPTPRARENLLREGHRDETIIVTGNTVIDALLDLVQRPWSLPPDSPLAVIPFNGNGPLSGPKPRIILVTAHRRESFGQPMRNICLGLRAIAETRSDVHLVYPVHPNPNVRRPVYELLDRVPNITLLPPLDYQSLVYLLKHTYLVLTDSGGLQEEAPSLGKPVLVLRSTTERPEAVEAGTARIVGTDRQIIVRETIRLLDDQHSYMQMAQAVNPYGDGHAAERIVAALLNAQSRSGVANA